MNGQEKELQCLLWMKETAAIPPAKALRLLERFGSAEAVYQASTEELAKICRFDARERQRLQTRSLAPSSRIIERCRALGISILPITDAAYPARLKEIYDPPLALYVRGTLPDLSVIPAVAVVGQRKATPYGLINAEKIAFHLSQNGVCVVSGMAAGIDSAGHRGALRGETPTVAVFGTAIDRCYPAENAALLRDILYRGAAVSEYPPGEGSHRASFVRRNRIISGLCLGVVVAEAPKKSGSLITASLALEQGRDVFAVPGGVDSPASEGCNELIANGAQLVRSAQDILTQYGFTAEEPPRRPRKAAERRTQPVSMTARSVAEASEKQPEPGGDPVLDAIDGILHLDEISRRTGIPAGVLMGRLTLLELKGYLRQLPGQYYERI
ncbi:MAG: DNA-processing protein DprA [Clostridia bacterium]|nr:DNA-processing protein DprA [Clostridia bacterium]